MALLALMGDIYKYWQWDSERLYSLLGGYYQHIIKYLVLRYENLEPLRIRQHFIRGRPWKQTREIPVTSIV